MARVEGYGQKFARALPGVFFNIIILLYACMQDFELLRQALPKGLTKYINFIEKIMIR